jgi:hypothetical protein
MNKRLTFAIAAVVAMLSACGGGNGADTSGPAVTSAVPDSANQSVAGLMSYLVALVAAQDEGLEPVDVSAVTPPTDDTIEPKPID